MTSAIALNLRRWTSSATMISRKAAIGIKHMSVQDVMHALMGEASFASQLKLDRAESGKMNATRIKCCQKGKKIFLGEFCRSRLRMTQRLEHTHHFDLELCWSPLASFLWLALQCSQRRHRHFLCAKQHIVECELATVITIICSKKWADMSGYLPAQLELGLDQRPSHRHMRQHLPCRLRQAFPPAPTQW